MTHRALAPAPRPLPRPPLPHPPLHALATLLLVAALWCATRPYRGIVHDAQLYLAQAMHRLDPVTFGADLFFRYGSQDRYSVISALYAPAVQALGPGGAHLAFFALASALWLSAVYALALGLANSRRLALAACVTACTVIPTYTYGVLQFGEPFATPRLLVEAAGMAALACIARGHRLPAYALAAVAMALHPLMALPVIGLLLVLSGPITRVFLPVLGAGTTAAIGLGLMGIDPFDRLFHPIDPEWLGLLKKGAQHGFVADWGWQTLVICTLPAVCLYFTARLGTPLERRIATGASGIAVASVFASWLLGDIFANLLVLNLQLWRALWLPTLLAACLAPAVYAMLPTGGAARPLFLAAIIINTVEARFGNVALPFASATLALASVAALAAMQTHTARLRRMARLASSALAAAATLLAIAEITAFATQETAAVLRDTLLRGSLILTLALCLLALARDWPASLGLTLALVALTVILVATTAAVTDRRDARMRLVTGTAPIDPRFVTALSGRTVYWEQGVELLWFRLRQPSYYSCFQGAGAMFFRETATEHARRGAGLRGLNAADAPVDPNANCTPRADPSENGPTTRAQIEYACRALPELDALVLYANLPDAPHLSWQPGFGLPTTGRRSQPPAPSSPPQGSYNLYLCADFRSP